MKTLETEEHRRRLNSAAMMNCKDALRVTGGEVPIGSCKRCGAGPCMDRGRLRGPNIGSPEWAVEQAGELNRTGKHRDEWLYYPTYHDGQDLWFVMRRRKLAEVATAVFITGELSGRE